MTAVQSAGDGFEVATDTGTWHEDVVTEADGLAQDGDRASLPVTALGKPDKKALRTRYSGGPEAAPHSTR